MTSWSSSIKIWFFQAYRMHLKERKICHGVKQYAKICAIGEQNVKNWSIYLRRTKNWSEEKEGIVEREKREDWEREQREDREKIQKGIELTIWRIRNIDTCLCLFPQGAFLLSSRLDSAVKRCCSELLKLSFQRSCSVKGLSRRDSSEVLILNEVVRGFG